jgi:hypothetical protein
MLGLAAASMATAPVAANAASALSLRAAAPMVGASFLQDEEDNEGGGSTAVILGVVLIVLIGIAAIGGSGSEASNSP